MRPQKDKIPGARPSRSYGVLLLVLMVSPLLGIQQNYGIHHQLGWNPNSHFISLAQKTGKTAWQQAKTLDSFVVPISDNSIKSTPTSQDKQPSEFKILSSPLKKHAPNPNNSEGFLTSPIKVSELKQPSKDPTSLVSPVPLLHPKKHQKSELLNPFNLGHNSNKLDKSLKAIPPPPSNSSSLEQEPPPLRSGPPKTGSLLEPENLPHKTHSEGVDFVKPLSISTDHPQKRDDLTDPIRLPVSRHKDSELIPVRAGVSAPNDESLLNPINVAGSTQKEDFLTPEHLPPQPSKNQDLSLANPVDLEPNPKLAEDVLSPFKLERDPKPTDLLKAVHIQPGETTDTQDWSLFAPVTIPHGLDHSAMCSIKQQLLNGTQILTNSVNPDGKPQKQLSDVEKYLLSISGSGKLGSRELFARAGRLFFPSRLRRYLKQLMGSTDPKRLRKKPYHRKHPTEDLVLKYSGRPNYELTRLNRYIDSKRRRKLRAKYTKSQKKAEAARALRTSRMIEPKSAATQSPKNSLLGNKKSKKGPTKGKSKNSTKAKSPKKLSKTSKNSKSQKKSQNPRKPRSRKSQNPKQKKSSSQKKSKNPSQNKPTNAG